MRPTANVIAKLNHGIIGNLAKKTVGKTIILLTILIPTLGGCSKNPTTSEVKDSRSYSFVVMDNSSTPLSNAAVRIQALTRDYSS